MCVAMEQPTRRSWRARQMTRMLAAALRAIKVIIRCYARMTMTEKAELTQLQRDQVNYIEQMDFSLMMLEDGGW